MPDVIARRMFWTRLVDDLVSERDAHRAVLLMTASSLLVPIAGIVSAPLLAHALGVTGRGEVAAAIAPNTLIASVATLGLPEALTYLLAKHPSRTRPAIARALVSSLLFGFICFVAAILALPFLSAGSADLGRLILLGTALVLPQMVINVFRGAASGRQLWGTVALERTLNSLIRVAALLVLMLIGHLNTTTAVITIVTGPILAGLLYVRLLRAPAALVPPEEPFEEPLFRYLHGFGLKVWIGAVSNMLLARLGQLLFAPLSTTAELGLYIVAVTISDVPLIVAIAIRDALYGVSSKTRNAAALTSTSRLALTAGTLGCLVLGVTLPLWITIIFGEGFRGAIVPTWILMASSLVNIPGFLAAAALAAWGKPVLRSVGLVLGLVSNVPVFLLLVPPFGADGAAIAALVSALISTTFMVVVASRVVEVTPASFMLVRRSDAKAIWRLLSRFRRNKVTRSP